MKSNIISFTIGVLLIVVGVAELIPAFVDWHRANYDNAVAFLMCSVVSLFFGGVLVLSNASYEPTLTIRQTFLLTTLSWFSMSFFASFPFYLSDLHLSFTDSFFEALSGITTTGSTVLSGLDTMSHGILIWRSMTQWIGGIGIVAFAIVFLPFLRIGGMQLFQTESSDRSEKVMPRSHALILSLFQVYCLLTILCMVVYYVLGMSWFDALNHALTTIPTGGYSTHDASFGYFNSTPLQLAASLFMLLGGIPFVLYVKLLFQGRVAFLQDDQVRTILSMIIVFAAILTMWLVYHSDYSVIDSFRYVVFNIVSVVTTTGYATTDYTLWGAFPIMFFFFLTYMGACAGSTTGGLKVMRLVIAVKTVNKQLKALIYPHGVFTVRYQGRPVDRNVAITVVSFLVLYVASNAVLTMALSLTGLDFSTAISGAATAIANVGPGIGDIIGPAGNFSTLPGTAKWLLCAGMLIGRLEIMTVILLFRYEFWRN